MKAYKMGGVIVLLLLLAGCGGDLKGEGDDDDHPYQGQACLPCHTDGKGSHEKVLFGGGTIYSLIDAPNGIANIAAGYTVRLAGSISSLDSRKGEGSGDFSIRSQFDSNFTAQVLNSSGAIVNSSSTLSHESTDLNCNNCHTASGANGAPGRIVNFYAPATTGTHNQGVSCLKCHAVGADSKAPDFAIGGTVYAKLDAADGVEDAVKGYSVRLSLETGGSVEFALGKGAGNFNANQGSLNIGSYTAEVLDSTNKVVNTSLANSHDETQFDCNRCHTADGANNAPGRIVASLRAASVPLYDTAAVASPSFSTHIMPILNNRCKLCHITQAPQISDANTTYNNLNTASLLDKSDGTAVHTGGALLKGTNWLETIKNWIDAGANND